MRFPWKKRQRGHYRSAKQKAQEEQSSIDFMMLQAWKEDLRQHPQYLRELTRQKFGMSDMGEGEASYEEPDFLSKVHEVADAKTSLEGIFGSSGGVAGGFMGMLNSIIQQDKDGEVAKAVAGFINLITGKVGQPGQPPQITRVEREQIAQPQPEQLAEPPTEKERMTGLAEGLLALQPEQVALYLYKRRETEGTVELFLWNSIIGLSVDDVLAMVPALEDSSYSYLVPLAQSLSKPSRRQWLGLVLDECNRLGSGEKEVHNELETNQ